MVDGMVGQDELPDDVVVELVVGRVAELPDVDEDVAGGEIVVEVVVEVVI